VSLVVAALLGGGSSLGARRRGSSTVISRLPLGQFFGTEPAAATRVGKP
jgi:hypothetical protein